jgi:O-antigen/teichoic acid export membrane protein
MELDRAAAPSRFARAGFIQAVATACIVVSSGLLTLSLARDLLPQHFAEWTLFVALLGYANHSHLGLIFGAQQIIPSLGNQDRGDRARTVHDSAWIAIFAPASLYGVVAALGWCGLLGCTSATPVVLAAVAFAAQPVLGFLQASLRMSGRFTLMSLLGFMAYAVPGILITVVALVEPSAISVLTAVLVTVMAAVATVVVGSALVGLPRRFNPRDLVPVLLHGLGPLLVSVLLILFVNLDVWFLESRGGRASLGVWGVALTLVSVSLAGIASFANVMYPTMIRERGSGGHTVALARWIFPLGMLGATWVVAITVVARPILSIVLPAYAEAAPIAVVLAAVGIELGLSSFCTNALLADRRYGLVVALFAVAVVLNVVADAWLLNAGLRALAIAKLTVATLLVISGAIIASRRRPDIGLSWLVGLVVFAAGILGVFAI